MKKLAAAGIIVSSWILTCVLAVAAELPAIPPIPEKFKDIKIIRTDPSVLKENAKFLGEWEGNLKYVGPNSFGRNYGEEVRRFKIMIYEVSPSGKLKLLFGEGDGTSGGPPGGWSQHEVDIVDKEGKKLFSFFRGGGFNIAFKLERGLLIGSSGSNYETEMKRIK